MALAWRSDWVKRGEFEFGYDRFEVHSIHCYSTQSLKQDFIPRLTPRGNKLLRDHSKFVRSQLIHYGVEFRDRDLTGNGTIFLKRALEAGLMDRVPEKIERMRKEMAEEWYAQLPVKDLAPEYPTRFVKQYFLNNSGTPDRTKTTAVLEIEGVGYKSSYRRGKIEQALNTVPGLHYTSSPYSMFVGWDAAAVGLGPKLQAVKLAAEEKAKSDERIARHENYVKKLSTERSPAGVYLIDCDSITEGWDKGIELELSICETDCEGIYEAEFEFNIISGVMLLATDKAALDEHCARLAEQEYYDEYGSDEENSEDESDGNVQQIQNGKRMRSDEDAQPPRKAKKTSIGGTELFLNWRGREGGEGEIVIGDNRGAITFSDARRVKFMGQMDMGPIGGNVEFTGMKISDKTSPRIPGFDLWSEYSEAAHESERIGRWH
ncbi:hypothetical protein FKW77_001230 [Venturia effusa]|uniref:Uncharacterized protein n=1 Tax=Venturia effusa TaxID=50376 RepID=A0A517LGK8_9PEZI|nr:hypothetical protein FKW77_001230 [Venturia effusa]